MVLEHSLHCLRGVDRDQAAHLINIAVAAADPDEILRAADT